MIINRYRIDIPPSDFSLKLHEALKDQELLKLDVVQQNAIQFFFRGYLKFKKRWWNLITRYMYLYLIFDFTCEEENMTVLSNWYEGNAEQPIIHQDRTPRISERLISIENSIHDQIELLMTNNEST